MSYDPKSILRMALWLAVLGLIVVYGSRFAGLAARRAGA
jgi:hypothetical protein